MKRVLEDTVPKTQQNSAFLRPPRLNLGESRHPPLQLLQDGPEYPAVFIVKIFDNERKVISLLGKVLSISQFCFPTTLVYMEFGYMPPFQKLSQCSDGWKSLELRKPLDSEQVGRSQGLEFPSQFALAICGAGLSGRGKTPTFPEIEEMPWLSSPKSPVAQYFPRYDRLTIPFVYFQQIGNERFAGFHPVFYFNTDRPICVSGSYFVYAAASAEIVESRFDVGIHGIAQKPEYREQCRFSCAVRTDKDCHSGNVAKMHIAKRPKIPYPKLFYLHRRLSGAATGALVSSRGSIGSSK